MTSPIDGLKSEALQTALQRALAGQAAELEAQLSRHGALPNPPNLRLAAAFGVEMSAQSVPGVVRLLSRLAAEDAPADSPRAFLPIAAAHGWVGRIRAGKDVERAWLELGPLAADERAPVRLGARDALVSLVLHRGGADELVHRATVWMDADDRELRFGAAATVAETLGEGRVLSKLGNFDAMLAYLSRVIEEAANAPRSAERSEARRRVLLALPRTLAAVAASSRGGERGQQWLRAECARADHPQVRDALARALDRLKSPAAGDGGTSEAGVSLGTLTTALAGSAKPPRDPSRIRPGKGRGKRTRRAR